LALIYMSREVKRIAKGNFYHVSSCGYESSFIYSLQFKIPSSAKTGELELEMWKFTKSFHRGNVASIFGTTRTVKTLLEEVVSMANYSIACFFMQTLHAQLAVITYRPIACVRAGVTIRQLDLDSG
jgi:hypothetical protein